MSEPFSDCDEKKLSNSNQGKDLWLTNAFPDLSFKYILPHTLPPTISDFHPMVPKTGDSIQDIKVIIIYKIFLEVLGFK